MNHHIKEITVTNTELKILLDELRKVQEPEYETYQSWFEDSDCEKWLAHIRAVRQNLEKNL